MYEVGQKVRILPYGYEYGRAKRTARGNSTELEQGEVIKVGRVRVTVLDQYKREAQYDMATGRECVRDFARSIETEEQAAEKAHRAELLDKLQRHSFRDQSTAKLEALLAVMESDL